MFGVRRQSEAATELWMSDELQFVVVPRAIKFKRQTLKFVGHPKRCRATLATALQKPASQLPRLTAKLFSPTEEIRVALVIYTKPGCPYCQQARDYYNSKGMTFIDHDAQTNRELRAEMLKLSGGDPTVPFIVKDG
jgi:glutaredoxin